MIHNSGSNSILSEPHLSNPVDTNSSMVRGETDRFNLHPTRESVAFAVCFRDFYLKTDRLIKCDAPPFSEMTKGDESDHSIVEGRSLSNGSHQVHFLII